MNPGETDELEEYLEHSLANPVFRAAYEAELRRTRRAWLGYAGRAYDREYRRRQLARRRRRR